MSRTITRRRTLLAACAGLAAPALGRAAELETLTLAIVPLASSGAVLIAKGKGWFEEAGIDLVLRNFSAAGPVPVAVVSGDADLGVTAMTAGFYNMAGQGAIKIIAGQSREQPGFELNGFVASNAAWDAGVRKFPDFAGRRLAITTYGSSVHYSVLLAARKYGIDAAKFPLVPLQSIPNMVAAFKGGAVEGIVSPVNTFRQMQAEGFGKIVAWVGDIAPWQLGGVFASPRTINTKRAAVVKFMQAYRRGCAAYNAAFNQRDAAGKPVAGPNYAEYLALLAKAIGQAPELVKDGLPYIDPNGGFDAADIVEQVALWKQSGQADASVSADAVMDRSFL